MAVYIELLTFVGLVLLLVAFGIAVYWIIKALVRNKKESYVRKRKESLVRERKETLFRKRKQALARKKKEALIRRTILGKAHRGKGYRFPTVRKWMTSLLLFCPRGGAQR